MSKLDKERQEYLEPERMVYAIQKLKEAGYEAINITDHSLQFYFKGQPVTLFPYTGWHTGKTITDGRGLNNILKQLK